MASEKVNIVIKAVDKTKRSFRAVTMGLNAIKKVAFSMQSALIAVGVAGFGFLIKKSMDATDALGKMADKIGIGTAELGGLRHAAELTGVATNTLDMGLQRMVRRVSEAASGSGEAKDALIELGLSAKALNALSPDQQFRKIADAMEGVAGQGEKVRLAMRLFDTEGVALVNTLKGGSAALIKMESEAERLGLRLSRGLVKGVEKANDAITVLSTYVTNIFHRAVGELAPAIELVTKNIREWLELKIDQQGGVVAFTKNIAISVLEASRSVIVATTSMLNSLTSVANGAARVINSVLTSLPESFGGLRTLQSINEELTKITLAKDTQTTWGLGDEDALNNTEAALRKLLQAGQFVEEVKPFKGFDTSGATAQIDALLAKLAEVKVSNVTKDVSTADTSLVDLTKITNAQIMSLRDDYDQMVIGKKMAHDDHILSLQNDYESIAEGKALTHQNKMNELTHQYLSKQSAMQKAAKVKDLGDLQDEGKATLKTLSGHYKTAFALNKAFALKDALINTYNGVAKAMNNVFPLNLGFAAIALANGMAQVSAIRSTQFREKGGPISAGKPYIVGERGPELIVPNQASNVVPNDQLAGGNFTINISANDTAGFDQLLMKRRGTIMSLINQSLNERGRPALA